MGLMPKTELQPVIAWLVCVKCKAAVMESHCTKCPTCGLDLSATTKHRPQDVKQVLHWYPQ